MPLNFQQYLSWSSLRSLFLDPTHHPFIQLVRYGLVVVVAFPVDFGLLWVFTSHLRMYYVLSATLSFSISMLVNYLLSMRWVFTGRSSQARVTEATTFAMVGFVGLGLTDLFIWTFTDFFKIQYLISKLIAVVIVFFWSFGARRYFIYRRLHPKVSDKTA